MTIAGKTVVVTGAGGFLGTALTRKLSSSGAQVRALIRNPQRAQHLVGLQGVELVTADITHPHSLTTAVADSEIVIHVAAALGGTLPAQLETNVAGTRNIARAAAQTGVSRFVHVSSIAVYGYRVRGTVTEQAICQPGNVPYNVTKHEAEQALIEVAQSHNLPYSINRPGMIYGAHSSFWTDKMAKLAKLRPTPFIGSGEGTAHIIHVDDVVDLLIQQATHSAAIDETFNCVTDPSPTWREFLGAYMQLAGHQRWLAIPLWLPELVAPAMDTLLKLRGEPQDLRDIIRYGGSRTQFSMEKAARLLAWQPAVTLTDGIQRCLPYLQEQGIL